MTPKEKAIELLFEKYSYIIYSMDKWQAKKCSLISVDEIINELQQYSDLESIIIFNEAYSSVIDRLSFWQKVKSELEKL